MLSIPSNVFQSSASRSFEKIEGHLSQVDCLLDGTLEPSAARKIQFTLKRLLDKTLANAGYKNEGDFPGLSQDEDNALQEPDNLSSYYEQEDLFRDDPPNSTYGSLDFPVTSSLKGYSSIHGRPVLCAPATTMG